MNNLKKSLLLLLCTAGCAAAVPVSAEAEEAPTYTMTAEEADLDLASEVILEGEPANLGNWTAGNTVGFYFNLAEAGNYWVTLEYSKEDVYEDAALVLVETPGDYLDDAVLPATGSDWSAYTTITLDEPLTFVDSSGYLWLQAGESHTGEYLINLRSVTLTYEGPVEEDTEDTDASDSGEASDVQILYESMLLPTMFYGESIWNLYEEEESAYLELADEMLYLFDELGIDTSEATSEGLIEYISEAYEIGFSNSIFDLTAYYLNTDPYYYREQVYSLLNEQLTAHAAEFEDYQMALDGRLAEAAMTFKDDWYGDTTDDERIALADAVLALLQSGEYDTGDYTGNTLAQAINDLYDQDDGNSMLFLAISLCGLDQEVGSDLADYLFSVVDDYFYDAE